jgi:zinc transporter
MGNRGLLQAYILDGKGAGRSVSWAEIEPRRPEQGLLWMHLDWKDENAQTWLRQHSGLSSLECGALLAEETRPRLYRVNDGLIVLLRGVNLNPGAQSDDMISIRMWLEKDRVITMCAPSLRSVDRMCEWIGEGRGPRSSGDFIAVIADQLTIHIGTVIDNLEEQIELSQENRLTERRERLFELRNQTTSLRRYIAPQRGVLSSLQHQELNWISPLNKAQLREAGDRALGFVEDLDAVFEHATTAQMNIEAQLSEQLNRRMYVLAVLTGVFLPLTLLTGLLGINVGGIPGSENPNAFVTVCLVLLGVVILQLVLIKFLKWF